MPDGVKSFFHSTDEISIFFAFFARSSVNGENIIINFN
jgi:hypothetical protein